LANPERRCGFFPRANEAALSTLGRTIRGLIIVSDAPNHAFDD
jgi:hypothetical protein